MWTPVHTVPKTGCPSTETRDAPTSSVLNPVIGLRPCYRAPDLSTAMSQIRKTKHPFHPHIFLSKHISPKKRILSVPKQKQFLLCWRILYISRGESLEPPHCNFLR